MDIFQTLILSIVEGITEFLPISSTGHLILTSKILSIPQTEFLKTFEIAIQLGAILAVVILYRNTFVNNFKIWKRIIAAFIPTTIIGFILYEFIKSQLFENSRIIVAALLVGGIVLYIFEKNYTATTNSIKSIEKLSLKKAFLIGLIQSLSVIPGVSRAASTIIGGLLVGLNRKEAVEFSFLLAVPTMVAATGFDILKTNASISSNEWVLLGLGMLSSLVVALVTIKYFIQFIKSNNFIPFAIYRIIIGIVLLLFVI